MTDKDGGLQGMINKVQDVAGGLVGRASAAMATDARSFVENAAISDLYEIGSGELALSRATSGEVREAARMMVEEHRQTTQRLRGIVGHDPALLPPDALDTRRATMMEHLQQAPDFDTTYVDQQVLAHQEALTLMNSYADRGDDEGLRAFATETAPIIERHLQQMKQLRASLP